MIDLVPYDLNTPGNGEFTANQSGWLADEVVDWLKTVF